MEKPEITRKGILDCQACVPREWDDAQILEFTEKENECGTRNGWRIRKQGDALLRGDRERMPCQGNGRENFVHVMLDV